jgi:hypothetical protein
MGQFSELLSNWQRFLIGHVGPCLVPTREEGLIFLRYNAACRAATVLDSRVMLLANYWKYVYFILITLTVLSRSLSSAAWVGPRRPRGGAEIDHQKKKKINSVWFFNFQSSLRTGNERGPSTDIIYDTHYMLDHRSECMIFYWNISNQSITCKFRK